MKVKRLGRAAGRRRIASFSLALALTTSLSTATESKGKTRNPQVLDWSEQDLAFFLHGSMSTEVVPEAVLRAFIKTYPDLFPTSNLSHLGLIPDPDFGWPIGFSRAPVKHLGDLSAVGINCASCHCLQMTGATPNKPLQILGATSHFDVEAFFGSVLVATFRTADPANMKRFLVYYLSDCARIHGDQAETTIDAAWHRDEKQILAVMKTDPFGSEGVAPEDLHQIKHDSVWPNLKSLENGNPDLSAQVHSMLQLFHNMRAALHVPDKPPENAPPASGPGRNDAFGLLSASLLHAPQPYSPIKFGLVWNVSQRTWVHWDGNTRSPIARNLLATLGLGAPMHDRQADLKFAVVQRQTDLSENIQPPHYPFAIDQAAAQRGAAHFETNCATCHAGPESDQRLHSLTEVGTDPNRASMFTEKLADGFNEFLAKLEAQGYVPPKEFGVRSTGKYWAPTLTGVWARSPYLHNGSVRTMQQLLTKPEERAPTFHRGSRTVDEQNLGYTDEGFYVFDCATPGNSNSGHDYATALSATGKQDLIEYLKTL